MVESHTHEFQSPGRWSRYRLFGRLIAVPVALNMVSTPASAHGEAPHGGTPVTLAIVVGLPVVVGLLAGITAIVFRGRNHDDLTEKGSTVVLGLLFLFLGGTFAIEAAIQSPWLALVGGTVGGIVVLWRLTHGSALQRGDVCHAKLTCGAISLHRVLEGLAIGTLYGTGAVVGILGAVTVAGHTVLETGAVAGQYHSYRLDAIAAIGLVQLSYAGGAFAGVGLTSTIPVPIQSVSPALAGGALFAIGAVKTRDTDILSHAARLT